MKRCETTEQIDVITWASRNEKWIPELKMIHHIPNEGKRSQATGGILKAAGVKKGVPDLSLPVPKRGYHGLYIELKYNGGKPTKDQKAFIEALRFYGYRALVCDGADAAIEEIRHYLARADNFDLVNCEDAIKRFDRCEGYKEDWAPCKDCPIFIKN